MATSKAIERAAAVFLEGMGAASATSGVLSQLQGRMFGLLYLQPEPLSLDEIAAALQQSKSNISINIRGLVDWHLVRRVSVGGSRRDHYEAATDFWRVMMEIMERRFRWNLRQVIAAVDETRRAATEGSSIRAEERKFVEQRLQALRQFAAGVDAGIEAFAQGHAITPDVMRGTQAPGRKKR
jgi:DNA-binding transcriptional regulator GbsR (MarR family)